MVPILKNGLTWLAAAALLATASASEQVVELDPAQTQVHFTVGSTLHTVHGEFKLKKGVIRFDAETGAASGAIVIDATSGDSGNSSRDSKMQKSVLESQKYPEITFTPRRVKGRVASQGDSQVEVEGTISLHGVDHPLTIPVKVTAKDGQITADTHFVVPYIQWGLKNPSTFILRVSDKVDIDIHATGRLARQ
jgi:polyisoprenoid-binding protein YceI